MSQGVLHTVILDVSNNQSRLELRIHSIQTVIIKSFVVLLNFSITRVDWNIISIKCMLTVDLFY